MSSFDSVPDDVVWLIIREVVRSHLRNDRSLSEDTFSRLEVGHHTPNSFGWTDEGLTEVMVALALVCKKFVKAIRRKTVKEGYKPKGGWFLKKGSITLK